MASAQSRKIARQEYKNRTVERGAFVVRCTETGRAWVGASPNLHAARNGLWFVLRHGAHRDAALQSDWNAFGEEAFQFDVLEALDPDVPAISISDLLKEKKRKWSHELGAPALL